MTPPAFKYAEKVIEAPSVYVTMLGTVSATTERLKAYPQAGDCTAILFMIVQLFIAFPSV